MRLVPRSRLVVLGVSPLVLLGACGLSGNTASAEQEHRQRWQEHKPSSYAFVLDSGCGERGLIGRFAVTVRAGEVTNVEALDEAARSVLDHRVEQVPSLDGLLDELDKARRDGADRVEATFDATDGHLTKVDIDYNSAAIDDEACYRISDYSG